MRSPSSPCTATRRPRLRPTAIPPEREARAASMVRAPRAHAVAHPPSHTHLARAVATPPARTPARLAFSPPSASLNRPQPRRLCAVCSRNVSGLPHVSRETFVPISHYITTIVSRETFRHQRWQRTEEAAPNSTSAAAPGHRAPSCRHVPLCEHLPNIRRGVLRTAAPCHVPTRRPALRLEGRALVPRLRQPPPFASIESRSRPNASDEIAIHPPPRIAEALPKFAFHPFQKRVNSVA